MYTKLFNTKYGYRCVLNEVKEIKLYLQDNFQDNNKEKEDATSIFKMFKFPLQTEEDLQTVELVLKEESEMTKMVIKVLLKSYDFNEEYPIFITFNIKMFASYVYMSNYIKTSYRPLMLAEYFENYSTDKNFRTKLSGLKRCI